jgi:hypothetical protein
MSTLSQYDGVHADAALRSATSLRRVTPGLTYVDASGVYGAAGVVFYVDDTAGCVTRTPVNFSHVYVVNAPRCGAKLSAVKPFAEQITRELDRLTDGWYGPGSKAPGREVLQDLDAVLSQLLTDAPKPDVEIDDDTGAVTLRWGGAEGDIMLALVFNGDRHVVAVTTRVAAGAVATSKVFGIADLSAIDRFLASDTALSDMLTTA